MNAPVFDLTSVGLHFEISGGLSGRNETMSLWHHVVIVKSVEKSDKLFAVISLNSP